MFKKNNLLDNTLQAKAKKLKLAKGGVEKAQDIRSTKVQNAALSKGFKVIQSQMRGNRGVKVSNGSKSTTIVLKTNFVKSGFNYMTKQNVSKQQVGNHASQAIKYIEREGANKDIDSLHSNLYNRNGERLTHEEYSELQEKLNEGVEAFRRFEFSPGLDLSREEMIEIVSNAVNTFNSEYGKNVETHFAVHTNTDNIHAHIFMEGSKADITMSKEQLQAFKVDLGIEVANVLNEKSLNRDFDKELEREIHKLDSIKKIEEIKSNSTEEKNEIKNELKENLKKEFSEQTKDLKFSRSELEDIKKLQAAEGAAIFAERNGDTEKLEKMNNWKSSILDKMSDITKDKLNQLDKSIEEFKSSKGAERLKEQADTKLLNVAKEEAKQLKEIGFSKAADNVVSKQREENSKDLKFSKEQAIEAKEKEHNQRTKEVDKTQEVVKDTTRSL
ncbi:hypothetical protein AB0W38_00345 [Aliarcobacter butzleri]|uniref:hypothetical protein n=1 Tax=Aliarcobacter butzleri TaxID=28197 RepID=UPI00344D3DFC